MTSPTPRPSAPGVRRTIVIGDIHGCMRELELLLKKVGATGEDEIIAIGDLVRKGPDSAAVLRWAMETPNLRSVLGNHEARLVTRWLAGEKPDRDSPDWGMRKDFGDAFNNAMDFLRTRPLHIEGEGFLAVHAGIDPRVHKLHLQSAHDLMTIRVPHGMDIPWYEAYTEERLIVFGHWARKEAVIRPNAIGLDTGCVYGGKLTALILPERRLVSVPAGGSYAGNNGVA